LTDIDVVSITSKNDYAYVNYMQVKEGAIVFSKTLEVKKKLDEPDEELLSYALVSLREQTNSMHREIISNLPIVLISEEIVNTIPKIGDKKKLLSLSLKNALEMQKE